MKRSQTLNRSLIVVALSAICILPAAVRGEYTINGGGGHATSDVFEASVSVGQPAIGLTTSTGHHVYAGFWYQLTLRASYVSDVPGPEAFRTRLHQNAPNPFNPSTSIRFEVAREGHVSLRIYDLRGREVARLADGSMAAGAHEVEFRPRNLASGIYLYRLITPDQTLTRRLVLVK